MEQNQDMPYAPGARGVSSDSGVSINHPDRGSLWVLVHVAVFVSHSTISTVGELLLPTPSVFR